MLHECGKLEFSIFRIHDSKADTTLIFKDRVKMQSNSAVSLTYITIFTLIKLPAIFDLNNQRRKSNNKIIDTGVKCSEYG